MSADGCIRFMDDDGEGKADTTENSKSDSGRACQACPSQENCNVRNTTYRAESHKRTDLRTTDQHYSWREVYHLLDVSGGGRP